MSLVDPKESKKEQITNYCTVWNLFWNCYKNSVNITVFFIKKIEVIYKVQR